MMRFASHGTEVSSESDMDCHLPAARVYYRRRVGRMPTTPRFVILHARGEFLAGFDCLLFSHYFAAFRFSSMINDDSRRSLHGAIGRRFFHLSRLFILMCRNGDFRMAATYSGILSLSFYRSSVA